MYRFSKRFVGRLVYGLYSLYTFLYFSLWNATRVYMCYPAPFSCGCLSVIHLLLLILRDVADRQRTQRETPPHVWQASAARVARRTDAGWIYRSRPRYALPGRTPLPCPLHSRSHARSESRATAPLLPPHHSTQLNSTPPHPTTTPRRTTLHHTTRTQPHAPTSYTYSLPTQNNGRGATVAGIN